MFYFSLLLLLHFVTTTTSSSNLGVCIFDTRTKDLVYKTFHIDNSTSNQSFYIEQNQGKKYIHKSPCIFADKPRVWKCPILKPRNNWKLVIKDKNEILHNFYWYFNKEKCVCLHIKPLYDLKVEINDPEAISLYKVKCDFNKNPNMLSVDRNEIYLDFGNQKRTLMNTCMSSFLMNPFNKFTPCNVIKICSKTKFLQCLNEGEPYCKTLNSLVQNDFLLKYFDCKVNSGSLEVNWDFRNVFGIQHVSLNFKLRNEIVLSKNLSSTSGSFIQGELSSVNLTMQIDSCSQCLCFRAKKVCFDHTQSTPKMKNTKHGLEKEDLALMIIIVILTLALICTICILFYYRRKIYANNNNQKPIIPRNIELKNISSENIYEVAT